jgi:hypothetical protein
MAERKLTTATFNLRACNFFKDGQVNFFESMLLLFCPIPFVSDNHFRFFFRRLNYFFEGNLKLRLKVSAVISGWGHASLIVENGIVLLYTGLKPPTVVGKFN